MTSASAGCGSWGCVGVDKHSIQEFLERNQIWQGCYNAGAHNGVVSNSAFKQRAYIRPRVSESQMCEPALEVEIKHSVAKRLWNIVRIYYGQLESYRSCQLLLMVWWIFAIY